MTDDAPLFTGEPEQRQRLQSRWLQTDDVSEHQAELRRMAGQMRDVIDLMVASQTRAGTVQRLDLAAPIRRTDGTRQGYVGASVSLRDTRGLLRQLASDDLAIRVVDPKGALIFPCRGPALTGGTTIRSGQFSVTVVQRRTGHSWSSVLVVAFAMALLILGLGLLRALDRRR